MNNDLNIDLTDLQTALNKVVRDRVHQQTKDVPDWQSALCSVYYDICYKIEVCYESKELDIEKGLTLVALETEGYLKALFHYKQFIEETLEWFELKIPND